MGVVIARTAVSTIWIARRLFIFFSCTQTHTQSTCFEARMMCSSPSSDVLYFILCRHTAVTSSGKTGEQWVVWGTNAKAKANTNIGIKKTERMERITSRDSVSVCAKKRNKQFVIRKTHTDFQFQLAPENWILCARRCTSWLWCVTCICMAYNEWRNDFLPQRIAHMLTKRFHSSFPFSICKCLLFVVTTDWVIRECIGGATGLKNDWQPEQAFIATMLRKEMRRVSGNGIALQWHKKRGTQQLRE